MEKVTAAVVRVAGAAFTLEQLSLEEPRRDEVLVRIHSTGICHTDMHARDGHMPISFPMVLGHEGAGIVARVGSGVASFCAGDHVILTHDRCGACNACQTGYASYCHQLVQRNLFGRRPDGSTTLSRGDETVSGLFFAQSSFATYALATERSLVKVPRDIDLSILGQLGCGVMTGAGAVLHRLAVRPGSSLLITGVGPVGMSAVMAAKVAGCTTIVVTDLSEARLARARELGATEGLVGDAPDIDTRLRALVPGGFNAAIDTTGVQKVVDLALSLLGFRGALVLLAPGGRIEIDLAMLLSRGLNVCGTSMADGDARTFIPELIALYREGRFPLDKIVTRYSLSEINRACEDARRGDVIKPVLMMGVSAP